jgi:MarR family transcriptional regulator, transcriptional regulator for hemolysin
VGNAAYDFLVLLNDLARSIRTEADKRARTHGMTRAQWMILAKLKHQPGLSQRELAEILEVEPITVARLVDRLEARDLVERRPDPEDRRIWRLYLCQAAAPVLEALNIQRDAILRLVTQRVDDETILRVCETLGLMKANMAAHRRPAAQPEETEQV